MELDPEEEFHLPNRAFPSIICSCSPLCPHPVTPEYLGPSTTTWDMAGGGSTKICRQNETHSKAELGPLFSDLVHGALLAQKTRPYLKRGGWGWGKLLGSNCATGRRFHSCEAGSFPFFRHCHRTSLVALEHTPTLLNSSERSIPWVEFCSMECRVSFSRSTNAGL